jgi:hypothetical protein
MIGTIGTMLVTCFAVTFWALLPAYSLIDGGYILIGILWGVLVSILVGSVLLVEEGIKLPKALTKLVEWIEDHGIHDCNNCCCGCGSPCSCKCKCYSKR